METRDWLQNCKMLRKMLRKIELVAVCLAGPLSELRAKTSGDDHRAALLVRLFYFFVFIINSMTVLPSADLLRCVRLATNWLVTDRQTVRWHQLW